MAFLRYDIQCVACGDVLHYRSIRATETGQHVLLKRFECGRILNDANLLESLSRVTGGQQDGRFRV